MTDKHAQWADQLSLLIVKYEEVLTLATAQLEQSVSHREPDHVAWLRRVGTGLRASLRHQRVMQLRLPDISNLQQLEHELGEMQSRVTVLMEQS